ncbi:MAG: AAA family ATPase [Lachnospiraceae bacterium]|jgi:type II secretory pathway predicted ATPase ExeA|nr:AAA family ATPase [Lachnospiraceae bacterium]
MAVDYTARYGLEFNPFLKNSKEIILESAEYREAVYRLNYLAATKGFGVLTGSAGRGKTTAIRSWAGKLNPSLYKVIYISLSTVTVTEFYRNLVTSLGGVPGYRKPENFRAIQEEIDRLTIEKRITPVIILDEANYIKAAVLNDLKILFNFDMDSKDRAVVLLAGLPQLNNTLNLGIHEPFRQRIVMNYNLEGLTKEEGRAYISTKLKGAGCDVPVFDENALEAILNASNGTPRLINKICNSSMLIGNKEGLNLINADIVMKAVGDCELG